MSKPSLTSPRTLGSVLVVGGCGFLGHHIVQALLSEHKSASVSVLDVRTDRNRFPNVAYYSGSIIDTSFVKSILDEIRPRVIIHTASPLAINNIPKQVFYKVNVEGTKTLIDCAKACGSVDAFVYTSSASVVHDSASDLRWATESLPVLLAPEQPEYYSETKGLADILVLEANDSKMSTVCIRPSGIFGEGDAQMIPNLLATLDAGRVGVQLGDNKKPFDYTYVGNVADAHILAAERLIAAKDSPSPNQPKVAGEAFFVTNDSPLPFWTFARLVWQAANTFSTEQTGKPASLPTKIRVIPRPVALALATIMEWVYWIVFFGTKQPTLTRQKAKFVMMERTYCIDKAKERLGYVPRVSLEEGARRAVRSAREKGKGSKDGGGKKGE
ncbi:MAG: erg26, C-3 sterol dehydrogenase [Icmadophila ericetorum]|nr:erg26, C-3 sterol dehydrogenase [Icmadophila ericetorum]